MNKRQTTNTDHNKAIHLECDLKSCQNPNQFSDNNQESQKFHSCEYKETLNPSVENLSVFDLTFNTRFRPQEYTLNDCEFMYTYFRLGRMFYIIHWQFGYTIC